MTTYYVDNKSTHASNNNAGTSATAPLRNLTGVENLNLKPGDSVLFKNGDTFSANIAGGGALWIGASGTAAAHITIGSYGSGALPIINNTSSDLNASAIEIAGSYVDIKNIQS